MEMVMSSVERISTLIKIEQLGLLKRALKSSYRDASTVFDRYDVWGFIDDMYEFFHIQGAAASFEDVVEHIRRSGGSVAL
jgi:hypothetical protein